MNPKMLLGLFKTALTKIVAKGQVEISKQEIGGFWAAGTLLMEYPGDPLSYVQIDITNKTDKIVLTAQRRDKESRFGKGTAIGVIEPTGV